MKNLFRIKWELILTLLLTSSTVFSYSVSLSIKDWRIDVITLISGLLLVAMLLGYKSIREFRKEVYRRW